MNGLPPLYPTFPSSSKVTQLEELNPEWSDEDGKILDKFLAENDYGLPRMNNELSNMVQLLPSTDQAQHISYNTTTVQGRQKPVRWTEEEHKLFLMGLDEHGKGDWSGISKNFVVTKTSSQVASHAQKYFRRLKCTTPVEKRRHSIHDTRIVNSKIVDIPPRSAQSNFNRDPVFYIANPPTQFWTQPDYMNF